MAARDDPNKRPEAVEEPGDGGPGEGEEEENDNRDL